MTLPRTFTLTWLAFKHRLPKYLLLYIFKKKHFQSETHIQKTAQQIRTFLEKAGPIFIKLGQNLSVYAYLIHPIVIKELEKLQDNCPPVPYPDIKQTLETTYGPKWPSTFEHFNEQPLACGSIAQVHTARLAGQAVILKILRPGIEKTIARDTKLLLRATTLLELLVPRLKKFKPKPIAQLFTQILTQETNLLSEASNTNQIKRQNQTHTATKIPKIYWTHCHKNILVAQQFFAQPVRLIWQHKTTLSTEQKKHIAAQILTNLLHQIFEHNFFHADMHPGNLMFDEQGHYIMIDFGITDSISENNQNYIALNFLAFLEGDYKKFTQFHIEAGWLNETQNAKAFENAVRIIFEPLIHKNQKDIQVGEVLMQLFQVAEKFEINIQPELVLMQRAMMNTENICRQIDPNIDTWAIFHPFLKKWLSKKLPGKMCQTLPDPLKDTLQLASNLRLIIQKNAPALLHQSQRATAKPSKHLSIRTLLALIIIIQLIIFFK